MAEKNISKIKISNNDEDIFLIKSKDFDKVTDLYDEVFGDDANGGLKKYVEFLENKISILEKKVDALYNSKTPAPLSFEYNGSYDTSFDDGLVESIVLESVTIGNTTRNGDFDKISVSKGTPISFKWNVLPFNALNKETVLSSNNDSIVFTDDHTLAAINESGEYLIFISSKDGSNIVKQIKINVI